jgi:putative DNA methylase
MGNRTRSQSSAALASSVWLVCRKRPANARPGWDNQVLEDMRQKIREMLREFWDAGIRGPDFVWAATGPALEAYSKHPVVKKANEPGPMTVNEFLTHVRRMVVDFVVGRVLSGNGFATDNDDMDQAGRDRLDEPTAYYLLHRHDFGMDEAPAGACILYAVSCGVSDKELADTWNLICFARGKTLEESDDEDAEDDQDTEVESGSKVKLKTWIQRKGRSLGYESPTGRPIPLIDRVHCLMHLWKEGDLHKVDAYLDDNGLRRQELFKRLLQSLIELSSPGSDERSLLESLSNHVQARGAVKDDKQIAMTFES